MTRLLPTICAWWAIPLLGLCLSAASVDASASNATENSTKALVVFFNHSEHFIHRGEDYSGSGDDNDNWHWPTELQGIWVQHAALRTVPDGFVYGQQFLRQEKFANGPGYQFNSDGTMIKLSTGWCGTPPITYMPFTGIWASLNRHEEYKKVISYVYHWFDERIEEELEIVALDKEQVIVKFRRLSHTDLHTGRSFLR